MTLSCDTRCIWQFTREQEKAGELRDLESICRQLTTQLSAVVESNTTLSDSEYRSDSEVRLICDQQWAQELEDQEESPGTNEHEKLVKYLQKKVEVLEGGLAERDELNAMLRAENRQKTAELLEYQLQKVPSLTSQVCPFLSVPP